ncbi:Methanol O-anthraniloyltransferase [Dichanthelium oligosanthes]|uniref:Methanol O-anthraniloyltransferase n=1 Tax=Dichanthelium oligosanthes TaxID=888268 RepID=A0A1E5VZC1_9POAL|nr:Methanol O-anthraniloyltransferase [Dichanthelium oligosanthes]
MGIFTVTKLSEGPVRPSAATPSETLPLAWVDRYPTHRGLVESAHIYRDVAHMLPPAPAPTAEGDQAGDDDAEAALNPKKAAKEVTSNKKSPAAVVRCALADALVHYYPFAGRIVEDVPGRPAVLCSADGVYFVEAAANCTLADVNFLERPLLLAKDQLVPCPTPELWPVEPHNSLAMIQVTTFTCGGFVVGLRTNHAVADGTGAAQFLNAVGDLARGMPEPRMKPVWARDRYPDPDIKPGPLPELPVLALEYIAFDFPTVYLDKLKSQHAASTGGKICSGFDIVIAKLWQCRTRAIGAAPGAEVRLCFFASVRHVLKLEHGYYGNAIFPVKVSAPAEKVAGSSVIELVGMVREAKRRVADECLSWAEGRTGGRDPFQMAFDYESVYVSDWSKLGFCDVDYGYGTPMSAGPLVNCDLISSVIVMRAPAPLVGTRLLASCVTKEHADDFARRMREDLI